MNLTLQKPLNEVLCIVLEKASFHLKTFQHNSANLRYIFCILCYSLVIFWVRDGNGLAEKLGIDWSNMAWFNY